MQHSDVNLKDGSNISMLHSICKGPVLGKLGPGNWALEMHILAPNSWALGPNCARPDCLGPNLPRSSGTQLPIHRVDEKNPFVEGGSGSR